MAGRHAKREELAKVSQGTRELLLVLEERVGERVRAFLQTYAICPLDPVEAGECWNRVLCMIARKGFDLSEFEHEGHAGNWAFACAKKTAPYLRSERRQRDCPIQYYDPGDEWMKTIEAAAGARGEEESEEAPSEFEQLRRAYLNLSSRERAAVELLVVQGVRPSDASVLVGRPAATLQIDKLRGLRRMGDVLRKEELQRVGWEDPSEGEFGERVVLRKWYPYLTEKQREAIELLVVRGMRPVDAAVLTGRNRKALSICKRETLAKIRSLLVKEVRARLEAEWVAERQGVA